jgi:hypothetical protein
MHESHNVHPLEPMIDFHYWLSSSWSKNTSDDWFQSDTVFLLTRQHLLAAKPAPDGLLDPKAAPLGLGSLAALAGCSRFVTGPEFNVINNCLSRFDGCWEDLFLKSSTAAGFDFSCVGRGTCSVNRIIANNS